MIRLLLRLLNIKDYEVCQSCETLKQQLAFERDEKKRLTDTLLTIIAPKAVETPPIEINPVAVTSALFSRRRAALEARDAENARIIKQRERLRIPDEATNKQIEIEKLETELGVGASEEKEA